jgi:serine/threonine-protein kinase
MPLETTALARDTARIMERTTFAEHYRVCLKDDGSPRELSRTGGAITYKANDIRSGEPVALKLIRIASVDPVARERFEEQAHAAQLLDHINIAKVSACGVEDDHFVFVSEYLEGETLDSWIAEHGPMALDVVLRIALQVISALSAASFHRLTHRAIRPSNLMIVPGPTAEGGWPFVKLINFGLTGFDPDSHCGETREAAFASPQQLQHGTVDFRSEIYSLGATMCFLLTGAAPSAGTIPLQQLSRFPKKVRYLLARMLRNNPDERPQDPVGFAQEIRECLLRVERRQALARRFGIPLVSIIPRMTERPQPRLPRRALALAALVLALAALAAILLAEPIRTILHRNRTTKAIGVPIGVPEASPEPIIASRATGQTLAASPAPTNATNVVSVQGTMPIPNQSVVTSSPKAASVSRNATPGTQASATSGPVIAGAANAAPPAEGPENLSAQPAGSFAQQKPPTQNANADAKGASRDAASESGAKEQASLSNITTPKDRGKTKAVASARNRRSSTMPKQGRIAAAESPNESETFARPRRVRAEFLGVMPDGNWILRLPSGRTAIVAPPPDEYAPLESRPRRVRRIPVERQRIPVPPPYLPMFPPDA